LAAAWGTLGLAILSLAFSLRIWVVSPLTPCPTSHPVAVCPRTHPRAPHLEVTRRGTISDGREREGLPWLLAGYITSTLLAAAASTTFVHLAKVAPACEVPLPPLPARGIPRRVAAHWLTPSPACAPRRLVGRLPAGGTVVGLGAGGDGMAGAPLRPCPGISGCSKLGRWGASWWTWRCCSWPSASSGSSPGRPLVLAATNY
jgi:hypothetical protein